MSDKSLSQPIRGARDFYPEDLAVRNWLFDKWRDVAKSFGYEEIDGPVLESFDLFAAKSGDELVNQQMYMLEDKDGRKLGVRPELTPTYSRMVAKRQNELIYPLRWTMFGNTWRYEKPQTGRSRDFWQWELNLVGGEESTADAEVLVIAAKAMEAIGLTPEDVVFRINDRRFMQESLTEIGISGLLYDQTTKLIDRREKISQDEFNSGLQNISLTNDQIGQLNSFLQASDLEKSPKLKELFLLLDRYGILPYCRFDPLIIRGITYYTGTVFECFDKNQGLRSVFGGGRFDDLVKTFGGGKIPAVGFAAGDVVIIELLRRLDKLPKLTPLPTRVLATVFSPDLFSDSLSLSLSLRSQGIPTELYPELSAKLDKQLKYASRKGIPYVAILGPEEVEKKLVTIKNMQTGEQKQTTMEGLKALIEN